MIIPASTRAANQIEVTCRFRDFIKPFYYLDSIHDFFNDDELR